VNRVGQPDPAVDEDSSLPVDEYLSHSSFALNRVSALARMSGFVAVDLSEDLQTLTAAVAFTKRQALHGEYSRGARLPASEWLVQVTFV